MVQQELQFDAPDRSKAPLPWTVSQLSSRIQKTLEQSLPASVQVRGEISNLSSQRHWYFTLKDATASISCVMWQSQARGLEYEACEGDEVIITGAVTHYPPSGRTQMIVSSIEPAGEGALHQKYLQRCRELKAKGWFDDAAKKPLPMVPRGIAIVTAGGSAALADVIATAASRCPSIKLFHVNVRVQGDAAAGEVAAAIRWLDAHHQDYQIDAVIVTRGGGSLEDLWAFNELNVAAAVHDATVPIVAAIGHESDFSIIELIADRRASTPTQATVLLVPSRKDLLQQIDHAARRLEISMRRTVERAAACVDRIAAAPWMATPSAMLDPHRARVDRLGWNLGHVVMQQLALARERLDRAIAQVAGVRPDLLIASSQARTEVAAAAVRDQMTHFLERQTSRVAMLDRTLQAVGPAAVLARGFAVLEDGEGRVIRSVGSVASGVHLTARVSDGTIEAEVIAAHDDESAGPVG